MQVELASEQEELVEKRGVVILVDSLGTKGILANRPPATVIDDWDAIVRLFEVAAASLRQRPECRTCQVATFSDTILLTTDGIEGTKLEELIVVVTSEVFGPFYAALARGVFLRGAITAGVYYQSGTKIIGPAIDEAAEWYERADWIGLVCSPTCERYLDLHEMDTDISRYFVRYPAPLKDVAPTDKWVFAWPSLALEADSRAQWRILYAFARFGGPVGVGAAAKYTNTVNFFKHFPQAT